MKLLPPNLIFTYCWFFFTVSNATRANSINKGKSRVNYNFFLYLSASTENFTLETSATTRPDGSLPETAINGASRRSYRANRGNLMAKLIALETQPSDESFYETLQPPKSKNTARSKKRTAPSEEDNNDDINGLNPMAPPKKRNKRSYDPKVSILFNI